MIFRKLRPFLNFNKKVLVRNKRAFHNFQSGRSVELFQSFTDFNKCHYSPRINSSYHDQSILPIYFKFSERDFHVTSPTLSSRKYLPDGFERMDYEQKQETVKEILRQIRFKRSELDIFKQELDEIFLFGALQDRQDLYGEFMGIYFSARYYIHIRVILGLIILLFLLSFYRKRPLKKNWKSFVEHLKHNEVEKITIHPDGVEIFLKSDNPEQKRRRFARKKKSPSFVLPLTGNEFEKRLRMLEIELSQGIKSYGVYYNPSNIRNLEGMVITYLSLAVTVIGLGYLFTRGVPSLMGGLRGGQGGGFGGGGDGAGKDILNHQFEQLYDSSVRFNDVAGLKNQKVEIMEFVDFMEHFGDFQEVGCELPRGCMLVGPPGCGKTMLAKAVAGECSMPFFSAVGSEFVEMFVGIGPQRVRELFREARASQPSIIFIDEIDAVGGKRGSGQFLGRNDERENTLNQLLIEMDGFSKNENVLVMAATNRLEILDPALLRAGRFDRQIIIPLPDVNERGELFELYMRELHIEDNDDDDYNNNSIGEEEERESSVSKKAKILARLSPGCSGADISNICNEAAIIGTRAESEYVELIHFQQAVDRVIGGFERKTKELSDTERQIVASHEAGHALVGWMLEKGDPPLKATIIPRSSGALGFTQHFPREKWVTTKQEVEAMMCMLLGGRAAEELCFEYGFSDGASSDLKRVADLAKNMTHQWGMFPDKIGHVSFNENPHILEIQKPFSDKTEGMIDEVIEKLVERVYQKTIDLLTENREILDNIVNYLLENDSIDAAVLREIIGVDPESTSKEFEEYMKNYDEIRDELEKKD